jgi:hypothetical protein
VTGASSQLPNSPRLCACLRRRERSGSRAERRERPPTYRSRFAAHGGEDSLREALALPVVQAWGSPDRCLSAGVVGMWRKYYRGVAVRARAATKVGPAPCGKRGDPLPGPKEGHRKAGTMTALRCTSEGASRHAVRNLRPNRRGRPVGPACTVLQIQGWGGLRRFAAPSVCGAAPAPVCTELERRRRASLARGSLELSPSTWKSSDGPGRYVFVMGKNVLVVSTVEHADDVLRAHVGGPTQSRSWCRSQGRAY